MIIPQIHGTSGCILRYVEILMLEILFMLHVHPCQPSESTPCIGLLLPYTLCKKKPCTRSFILPNLRSIPLINIDRRACVKYLLPCIPLTFHRSDHCKNPQHYEKFVLAHTVVTHIPSDHGYYLWSVACFLLVLCVSFQVGLIRKDFTHFTSGMVFSKPQCRCR